MSNCSLTIDPTQCDAYYLDMDGTTGLDAEQKVDSLATQLQELIGLCEKLKGENSALRAQERELSVERAKLIEKNQTVRSRVEAMISRLKAMEGD